MENWCVRAEWHPLLLLVDGKPGENKQTLSRSWSSSCGCDTAAGINFLLLKSADASLLPPAAFLLYLLLNHSTSFH